MSSAPVPWEQLGDAVAQADLKEWASKWEKKSVAEKSAKMEEIAADIAKQQAKVEGGSEADKPAQKLQKLKAQHEWLVANHATAPPTSPEKPEKADKVPASNRTKVRQPARHTRPLARPGSNFDATSRS